MQARLTRKTEMCGACSGGQMGYGVHHFALRPDRAIQMWARARRASRSAGGLSQPVGTSRVSTAIEQSLVGAPEPGLKGLTLDVPGQAQCPSDAVCTPESTDKNEPLPMNPGNIQHPTSHAQHPMTAHRAPIGCSMLDVGCWMFSSFGSRVQSVENGYRGNLSPPDSPRCRAVAAGGRSGVWTFWYGQPEGLALEIESSVGGSVKRRHSAGTLRLLFPGLAAS
jgi:hypothetical protein